MKSAFKRALGFPVICAVILWIIHSAKVVLHLPLNRLGILPREVDGLKGVIFSPLIHGDWGHLISNTAPLMVMTFVLAAFYSRVAYKSFFLIYIFTGLSVWLMGRDSFHIGASGVVYGLVSFVFWSGVFRRNAKSIVIALVILFMYSGLLIGVLPTKPGISWESHLLGGVMGIIFAYLLRHQTELDEVEPSYDLSSEPKKRYFDEDPFGGS